MWLEKTEKLCKFLYPLPETPMGDMTNDMTNMQMILVGSYENESH